MLRFLSPHRPLFIYFLYLTVDPRVILFNWSYPVTLLRLAEEKGDMQSSDIHSTIAASVSLGKSSVKVCQWGQC